MSGTIFVDLSESNPLTCRLCAQELMEPMTLPCQHSFCAHCIGAATACGLCETPFDAAKLAVDPVLTYVLESSKEATESCANCDQISQPMNFCETCQQPLCGQCVVLTHSAKFFASHQISPLDERGRQRGQPTCAEHNGPFVLFCQETKKLMCIECFNASSLDKRHSFVNLDVAHKQCREKLDESVVRLRAFQDELVEQNDARRRLLVDLEAKYAAAEEKLLARFNALVSALTETKSKLLAEIREIRADRKSQVERQLKGLENVEGPIRTNLLCASVFCSYASHFDLLHCYAELHRNINSIIARKTEKVPFSSNLELDWDERINDVLKRDLEAHSSTGTSTGILPLRFVPVDLNAADSRGSSEPLNGGGGGLMHLNSRTTLGGLSFSHLLAANGTFGAEAASGVFVEHFQKMDAPLRQFTEQSALLSKSLLGLQRDITFNQRVVDKQTVESLIDSCDELEQCLDAHSTVVNDSRTAMIVAWNEQMEALQKQQLLVNNCAHELAALQRFTRNVAETSRKLQPLTSFLSAVIQTIRPAAVEITPPMEQICSQIASICPDSKQRVEAIEKEEEQRRLTREREKRACEEETRGLKKGLRETRKPRTRPLSSALLVENSRDRNDVVEAGTRRKQQRLKRSSQSDESSTDPRCSSRVFSSTTSLDAGSCRTDGHSPASTSPGPLFEDELEVTVERLSLTTPARPTSAAAGECADERAIVKSPPQTPPPPPKRPPSILVDAAPSAETIQARHLLMQSIKDRVKRID